MVNGDSSVEAAQARVDGEGNTFTTLKERIDSADVLQIKIEQDIDSTAFKGGRKVDINYLKSIQAQKYALAMRKLRKGEALTITCQGDSMTYGYDVNSADVRPADTTPIPDGSTHTPTRASTTYPEALAEYLSSVYSGGVTTINRGYSGDYAARSYTRWFTKHAGDLTILMLGTNDSRKTDVPNYGDVEHYLYWMEQIIIRELIWGKAVILMTPPKLQVASDMNVETFAHALHLLGHKYGIPVIDTQELLANYSSSIYSDVTHLNGAGYRVLGAKVSAAFIGEGVAKPYQVSTGSTMLMRPMVDNIHYISNSGFYSAATTGTPDEAGAGAGIFASIEPDGSVIYSFYNQIDNLVLLPNFYLFANSNLRLTVDFGVQQPQRSLDSTYFINRTQHEDLTNYVEYSSATTLTFDKKYLLQNKLEPLFILTKGWHTIKVSATVTKAYWYGLEFMSFQEYYNLKNLGSIKETLLFEGAASSGVVTLTEDITKFKHLLVVTGSATDGSLQTGIARGFGANNFRVGTDYIRVPTAAGSFVAKVTGTKEITIQSTNNNLRYIYGINEYVL